MEKYYVLKCPNYPDIPVEIFKSKTKNLAIARYTMKYTLGAVIGEENFDTEIDCNVLKKTSMYCDECNNEIKIYLDDKGRIVMEWIKKRKAGVPEEVWINSNKCCSNYVKKIDEVINGW